MNAEETLKLISTKTWCNINDLMKLTGLSRSSALKIRNKIKDTLNYEIHTRDLPMNVVIDYLNIDVEYFDCGHGIHNEKPKQFIKTLTR